MTVRTMTVLTLSMARGDYDYLLQEVALPRQRASLRHVPLLCAHPAPTLTLPSDTLTP